jgi:hypothetical protein
MEIQNPKIASLLVKAIVNIDGKSEGKNRQI